MKSVLSVFPPCSPETVPVQVLPLQRVPEGQPEDARPVRPPQALRQQPVPGPPPPPLARTADALQSASEYRRKRPRGGPGPDWHDITLWDLTLSWQQRKHTIIIVFASP